MILQQYTFLEYAFLSEEERLAYQEALLCAEGFEHIDCKKWKWGKVKFAQDMLQSELTFPELLDLVKLESERLDWTSPAHVVMKMFFRIQGSIKSITEFENEQLQYQSEPKEMAAASAVGGFEKFGTLPQSLSLVGIIAPSLKEVEECDWSTAFMALLYNSVKADYQRHLYKQ